MQTQLPTVTDVYAAYNRVKSVVVETPLIRNRVLDERAGRPVYVKCEPLQHTGSFKFRGAYNRLVQLSESEKSKGVVAFSSGNHAQGVARAANLLGIKAQIVMPKDSPQVKIDGVLRDGGDIIFYDRFSESREEIAAKTSRDTGAIVVPSFDDVHIIAGQGSCGVEITQQYPDDIPPSQWVCCVGGGGLISGTSLALKDKWPNIEAWGVEPEGFDDFARSIASGTLEANAPDQTSICDALLTVIPAQVTFDLNRSLLKGIVTISDDEAREAVRFAFEHLKLTVEPGGAAALAATLFGKIPKTSDGPICLILSGGNIDPAQMAEILSASV